LLQQQNNNKTTTTLNSSHDEKERKKKTIKQKKAEKLGSGEALTTGVGWVNNKIWSHFFSMLISTLTNKY